MLYKVRSEYANAVCSPYKKVWCYVLEWVQRRAAKLINSISIKHLTYENRLKKLYLPTLKYRRARGDMIEVFKILHGYYDNINNISFCLMLMLLQWVTNINCIKVLFNMILESTFSLTRVVSLWNSLADDFLDSWVSNNINWWCFGLLGL